MISPLHVCGHVGIGPGNKIPADTYCVFNDTQCLVAMFRESFEMVRPVYVAVIRFIPVA